MCCVSPPLPSLSLPPLPFLFLSPSLSFLPPFTFLLFLFNFPLWMLKLRYQSQSMLKSGRCVNVLAVHTWYSVFGECPMWWCPILHSKPCASPALGNLLLVKEMQLFCVKVCWCCQWPHEQVGQWRRRSSENYGLDKKVCDWRQFLSLAWKMFVWR